MLDSVRIYNQALSTDDVQSIYQYEVLVISNLKHPELQKVSESTIARLLIP